MSDQIAKTNDNLDDSRERERRIGVLLEEKKLLEEDLKSKKWNILMAIPIAFAGIFVGIMVYRLYTGLDIDSFTTSAMLIYVTFLLGAHYTFRTDKKNKLIDVEYQLIKLGNAELKEHLEENFFTKLIQINFKYIDQYYLQTQEQANKSFTLSSFASIVGLVIIITGIVMMYLGETTPAYVTTASGIISEMIAAVFFYLYNRTILKMSQYHQKLVLTQNISLALKISDGMSEENKATAQQLLIDRLTSDVNKYLSTL